MSTSPLMNEAVQRGMDLLVHRTEGWDKSRYLRVD
jgi:hypothetical protein